MGCFCLSLTHLHQPFISPICPSFCLSPACLFLLSSCRMLSFLLIVSPPFLLSTHVLASGERFLQAPWPLPHASWPPEAALHPEGGATQPRLVQGSLSHKKVISADLPWPWEPEVRLACPQPGGRARAPEGSLSHTHQPDQPVSPRCQPTSHKTALPLEAWVSRLHPPGSQGCGTGQAAGRGEQQLRSHAVGALTSVLHFFPQQPWNRTVIIPVFPDGETEA